LRPDWRHDLSPPTFTDDELRTIAFPVDIVDPRGPTARQV
jgi:hypothetical protein